jgi:hypothetical protein
MEIASSPPRPVLKYHTLTIQIVSPTTISSATDPVKEEEWKHHGNKRKPKSSPRQTGCYYERNLEVPSRGAKEIRVGHAR